MHRRDGRERRGKKKALAENGFLRFVYTLAFYLRKTVRELTGEIGTDELVTWMAFLDLYPPEQPADVRAARLAFYSANTFRKAVSFDSMLREFAPSAKRAPQTPEALAAALSKAAGADLPEHIAARKWKH